MPDNDSLDLAPFQAQLVKLNIFPIPAGLEVTSSIRLILHESNEGEILIGASKIGGRPDLPADTDWPFWNDEALSFLGQINLADLQGFSTAKPFPQTGLLSFFYQHEQSTWGFNPSDDGSWCVLFTENPSDLMRKDTPDLPENFPFFHPCTCEFHESLQISDLEPDEEMVSTAFSDLSWLEFGEEINSPSDQSRMAHRFLGKPNPLQNPNMDMECQLVTNGIYLGDAKGYHSSRAEALASGAKDWMLLFQLDSDDKANMMWGDVGRLYFWIRQDDLIQHRFDQVWMIFQCC